jgi:hypothetical protein
MSGAAFGIHFPSLEKNSDDETGDDDDDHTAKTEQSNSPDNSDSLMEETASNFASIALSSPGSQKAPIAPGRTKSPPPSNSSNNNSNEGELSPGTKAKYGYEEAPPTPKRERYTYDASKLPRRSSMKSEYSSTSVSRRESIGSMSTQVVEVRVRGERKPIQRRRSINFDPQPQVQTVEKVTTMASSHELWVQEEEMAQMKANRKEHVRKLKMKHRGMAAPADASGDEEEEEEDFRGLEKYVDKTGRIRRMDGWDAVLWEQEQQEIYGKFDDTKIAELYSKTTGPSPDKAAQLAKKDAEDIEQYLMTPRTTKLMMRRLSC